LVEAVPSAWPHIEAIGNQIITGSMYKALKAAKVLIAYEKDLLEHASRSQNLRRGREANRQPA
jgi:flagellar protein FlbT